MVRHMLLLPSYCASIFFILSFVITLKNSSCRGCSFISSRQQPSPRRLHRSRSHNQYSLCSTISPSAEQISHEYIEQQQQQQQLSLLESVTLSCDGLPFVDTNRCEELKIPIAIDPSVLVDTDILSREGSDFYKEVISQWRDQAPIELFNSSCINTRISQLSRDSVVIQWNASFIPDSIRSLATLAATVPGWRAAYFNILDRESIRSPFSWQALGKFCWHLFLTGEMRLPAAVILGTTELRFKETTIYNSSSNSSNNSIIKDYSSHANINADNNASTNGNANSIGRRWTLVGLTERISLVSAVRSGRLKNRRLALDLLEFLDARKPASIGVNDWNDLVLDRVPVVQSVPGMRQFDVDGLEGEDQERILTASNSFLGYLTAAVLILGLCSGTVVLDHVLMYRQQVSEFDARINQEIY